MGHLCSAIRKLAAVTTPDEATEPLYRGIRGELPRSFWVRDENGMVTATDRAFMSTSLERRTPCSYMSDSGANVLWELQPSLESDGALHRGADISFIAQFAHEREVLFPPFTMLTVLPRAGEGEAEGEQDPQSPARGTWRRVLGAPAAAAAEHSEMGSEGGKTFLRVRVEPSFV